MNKSKDIIMVLKYFLASTVATFVVFAFTQRVAAFFVDIQRANETARIMSATLDINVSGFQIKNNEGNWDTSFADWTPYGVTEFRFTTDNVGYDDVVLTNTIKMYWDDTSLDPSVLVLYPASMSDDDIIADITSTSPTSAIHGTTGSESGQPFISFTLNDGRLNGGQSGETAADKTKVISYKLVFNHGADINYEFKTVSVELATLANYYHNPVIAWNSFKDDLEPVIVTTAVASGNLFALDFNANGGNDAPSDLQYRSDTDTSHTFTIPAATMTYDLSHIFMGWSTSSTATNAEYQQGDSITVEPGSTTLYAVWKNPFTIAYENANKTMSNNYFVMQDISTAICNAVETPTVLDDAPATQLKDSRDGKIYWVAKLADGKCWMTQNLDFDLKSGTQLTNANTDLTSKTSWTPGNNTIDASDNVTTTGRSTTINWRGSYNTDVSLDVGDVYYIYDPTSNAVCSSNGYLADACSVFSNTPLSSKGEHSHVGNYYDFAAAVAENGIPKNGTNKNYNNSVCPANWRMSYSTGSDDFASLASAYGANGYDDILLEAPVYFVRSGYVYNSLLRSAGDEGQLWTAKIGQNTNNKTFGFIHGADSAETNGELAPGDGLTIRCIAR